jgi:hypothetical protein
MSGVADQREGPQPTQKTTPRKKATKSAVIPVPTPKEVFALMRAVSGMT